MESNYFVYFCEKNIQFLTKFLRMEGKNKSSTNITMSYKRNLFGSKFKTKKQKTQLHVHPFLVITMKFWKYLTSHIREILRTRVEEKQQETQQNQ